MCLCLCVCLVIIARTRIDHEALGLKAKVVLDSIGVCLARDDFKGDVICDVLTDLLRDAIPAVGLMRTAILSCQKYSDIKRFILVETIPALVRKRVWAPQSKTTPTPTTTTITTTTTAAEGQGAGAGVAEDKEQAKSSPALEKVKAELWKGVGVCLKMHKLWGHKDAEPTLRCLLGLPASALKPMLKNFPDLKPPLAKLLQALSVKEKDEVLSGRWAGIDVAQALAPEDAAKADTDKAKLVKELQATK